MEKITFIIIIVLGGCAIKEGQRGYLCTPAAQTPALIENWGDLIKVSRFENIRSADSCINN